MCTNCKLHTNRAILGEMSQHYLEGGPVALIIKRNVHVHTYLHLGISESTKEHFLEQATQQIQCHKSLQIEHTQTPVRVEQVHYSGIELLLLQVSIADHQTSEGRGSQG